MWWEHLSPIPHMSLWHVAILVVTWPYHRSLTYFTLEPCAKLAEDLKKDPSELPRAINHWCLGKKQEYDFVCNASTLAAIADLSVFSWTDIGNTYWLAAAFFYFSLSLSLWAVILSAQQKSVSRTLAVYQDNDEEMQLKVRIILRFPAGSNPHEGRRRTFAESNMLYVWQCPLMLMSYGWATLLVGLTLHVCSPLIDYTGHEKRKVAIFYLVTGGVLFLNFAWSSAWSFWRPKMSKDAEKAFRNRNSVVSFSMPSSPIATRDSMVEFTTPFTPTMAAHATAPPWTAPSSPRGTTNSAVEFATPSSRTATIAFSDPRAGPEEKEKFKLNGGPTW